MKTDRITGRRKKKKKSTITISFDEEKLSALRMYLSQKNATVESELEKMLDTLYSKTVPAGVRDFIEMKSGNAPQTPAPRPKKAKPSLSSAVGADTKPEVHPNE